MRLFFTFYIILEIVQRPKHSNCVPKHCEAQKMCLHPSLLVLNLNIPKTFCNILFILNFVLPLQKNSSELMQTFFSSRDPRFMCLHQLCSSRWAWVVPYYLILILPSLGGSQSLTVSHQNHKTSSLQQWVRIHACVQTKCEANFLSVLLSLWLNSELTHNSSYFTLNNATLDEFASIHDFSVDYVVTSRHILSDHSYTRQSFNI